MTSYPETTRAAQGEWFSSTLAMALNDGLYGVAAQMIADKIEQATTPVALAKVQRDAMGIKRIIGVGGIPAIDDIGYELAPDATPVEDEHRVLLDVIRALVATCDELLDVAHASTCYMEKPAYFRGLIKPATTDPQKVMTRANAILAEHSALDIAPEHSDEDNA